MQDDRQKILVAGLPRVLLAEFDAIARRHERTRSQEIRFLISEAVEREREKEMAA